MLMTVSLNVFADNADKDSFNRSVSDIETRSIVLEEGRELIYAIPIYEGYCLGEIDTSNMNRCVSWEQMTRSLILRFQAVYKGQAVLRVILYCYDGGPDIIIDIYITVTEKFKN